MKSKAWQVEKAIRYPCFLIPRTLFFFVCLSTALFDPSGGKAVYTIFRSSIWTNSVKFSFFFLFSSPPLLSFYSFVLLLSFFVSLPSTESFAASYKQDNYYFSFSSDLSNLRSTSYFFSLSTSSIQTRKKVDERERKRESFFKRDYVDYQHLSFHWNQNKTYDDDVLSPRVNDSSIDADFELVHDWATYELLSKSTPFPWWWHA